VYTTTKLVIMGDEIKYEWVEVLEPETQRKMYANIITGDCLWEAPSGVPVKPNHENQWWELHDANTERSYYYNASSHATVWERPATGEIVALAKLQQMQEELAKQEHAALDTATPNSTTTTTATATQNTTTTNTTTTNNAAVTTTSTSSIPNAPDLKKSDLAKYDQLGKHKKGIIFKKKVTIATMLKWSKECIPSPMLMTLKKPDHKSAVTMFKQVQMAMGDRGAKGREFTTIVLTIIAKCWTEPQLRDELYLQVCKQTTQNTNPSSCDKGWELLCIAISLFPPTNKFFYYLEGYIHRNVTNTSSEKISAYTTYCLRKLPRIRQTGARKGNEAPKLAEIEQALKSIFNPSQYGSTLDEVMEVQAEKKAGLEIPWVVTTLTGAILRHKGDQTEGIFRVPGDMDAVNALKVSLDKFEDSNNYHEPHVPASALKLWFRELPEPLIPESLYNNCINSYASAADCIAVLDLLPALNRKLLTYAIRFLQIVGQPKNQSATKMNYDNLSMVWAPNFLRCPSEDPMVIFNNTKKEMSFVRHLVKTMKTDDVGHLGLPTLG